MQLTSLFRSDILSVMAKGQEEQVFTIRDLNRQTSKVLEVTRQHGKATIRGRNGEEFQIFPTRKNSSRAKGLNFQERQRKHMQALVAMGAKGPADEAGIERLNQIIAGEE